MALVFLVSSSAPSFAYEHEIKILSASMSDNIAKAGKKRIAVVDFTDLQGNVTELGRFIAEELSVDLINTAKGFEVIDRNHLNRILAEHKLSVSGIVDQKTIQKLGQIAGVDALITGSITPLENSVRVVCKVIATDTARVISAAKGDIAKTKAIEELFGKGIEIPSGTASPSQVKPKTLAKAELRQTYGAYGARDFTFEARECKAKERRIRCTIAVVSNSHKTTEFQLNRGEESILIDDFGNQYQPYDGGFLERDGRYDNLKYIPPAVPMNFFLMYDDVPTTTKYVTVIVHIQGMGKAVLRNIPLSR